MKNSDTISVGKLKGLAWIRCEAKGNFNNSSVIEKWATAQLRADLKSIIVDLEKCSGMDSTFMGNLAGLAMKMSASGGRLQIIDASEKCENSLIDLGLATLMDINPVGNEWDDEKKTIRSNLVAISSSAPKDKLSHVYETHKNLCQVEEANVEKFNTVMECLEAELVRKNLLENKNVAQ